jgi:hypothetical protein
MSETATLTRPAGPEKAVRGSLGRTHAFLIWLPPAVVVGAAAAAWHFVSFAFISNPGLNGLILGVMLWGALSMVVHVRTVYREDRVFFAGLDWLRKGAWSSEPDPHLGPQAYVLGMLGRLEKLGLGHQVYVQSAAMEPELEALSHHFEKKQELSQFLVGLMVGLGLLGTFVGLLETLIATSELIGTIAKGVGGGAGAASSSGGMEAEFAHIVGGLQKPLESMGTAFSASMFGLIGSIVLGFQMVVVRKAAATLVDNVREEVLSLAEKTTVNANVEITERFLATLLADVLEQHRQSEERLAGISRQIAELTPAVTQAALSSTKLAEVVAGQHEAMDRATMAVGQVRDVVPLIAELASAAAQTLRESTQTRAGVDTIARVLPDQVVMAEELRKALAAMQDLSKEVGSARDVTRELTAEVRLQGSVVKRLDATLWNAEKTSLRKLIDAGAKEPTA